MADESMAHGASIPGLPLTLRARFNCAGVGKSKLGEGLGKGFFDSLFLADGGGEEQDD